MPAITLTVCVHGDRSPLARLLDHSVGCFDELLVVHDGPDFEDVAQLVQEHGGNFFIRPRAYSQEPHFPFAFAHARHDWILRLDSDEFPSAELRAWVKRFREGPEPSENISAYQCIWPAWNGRKPITRRWPNKRTFLFHRNRVQCIGVYEQGIMPEHDCSRVPFVLHHEPPLRSHSPRSVFRKSRTAQGRTNAVEALTRTPLDLPRWRYNSEAWPPAWEKIRRHPIRTGLYRLIIWPLRQATAMMLAGDWPRPAVFLHSGVFHAVTCLEFWRYKRRIARTHLAASNKGSRSEPNSS
jgi:hypothetical protein